MFRGFGALSLFSLDIRIRKNSQSRGKSLQEEVKKRILTLSQRNFFCLFCKIARDTCSKYCQGHRTVAHTVQSVSFDCSLSLRVSRICTRPCEKRCILIFPYPVWHRGRKAEHKAGYWDRKRAGYKTGAKANGAVCNNLSCSNKILWDID